VSVLVRPATGPGPGPGPDPQPGPTPGPGPAPGGSTPEATSVTTPSSVTLADLLSPNGVAIPLTCSSDCTVTGTLDIAAKDLNSLTAVVRVVRIGNGSVKLKAGAKGKLRMKLTARARKLLRAALKAAHVSARRKIRLNLTLHSKYRSGKKKTIRRKIILRG
jgi:hypothetical protein